ncbi:MAG: hypothetical protein AAFN91_00885 [Pseudomonadota bacterium]
MGVVEITSKREELRWALARYRRLEKLGYESLSNDIVRTLGEDVSPEICGTDLHNFLAKGTATRAHKLRLIERYLAVVAPDLLPESKSSSILSSTADHISRFFFPESAHSNFSEQQYNLCDELNGKTFFTDATSIAWRGAMAPYTAHFESDRLEKKKKFGYFPISSEAVQRVIEKNFPQYLNAHILSVLSFRRFDANPYLQFTAMTIRVEKGAIYKSLDKGEMQDARDRTVEADRSNFFPISLLDSYLSKKLIADYTYIDQQINGILIPTANASEFLGVARSIDRIPKFIRLKKGLIFGGDGPGEYMFSIRVLGEDEEEPRQDEMLDPLKAFQMLGPEVHTGDNIVFIEEIVAKMKWNI